MSRLQAIADTARWIALRVIARSGSGHPGIAAGCAELGVALFHTALRYDPDDTSWPNRDRFVLSAGHASALLYSLQHLYGHGVSREDLLSFRRFGSRTPGHPEFSRSRGIEATTGPLGEGLGVAVGLALAETMLGERFNRPGYSLVDHRTVVLASDGDLMEGVGQEAVSLAGRLGLGKLVVVWDRNDQTSSGPLSETCADDVPLKFRACGWAVLEVDGHDIEAVARALNQRTHSDSPLLVAAKTSAGRGLPKVQGSHRAHAAALSEDEVMELARAAGVENIGSLAPTQVVTALIEERRAELARARGDWNARLSSYARAYPELHSEFVSKPRFDGSEFDRRMTEWKTATTTQSTRDSFGTVVDAIFDSSPLVVGASIDSHKAFVIRHGIYSATNRSGRNVNCGVREHAMGALLNGLAYYDLRPFGVCFAAFLDHLRPSLRLAAMDSLPLVVAAVNDSALSGEDGPTHQAVEQLAGLRAMPNLVTFRPADLLETVMAWMFALENRRPVVMFLSKVACRPISSYEPENSYDGVLRGGYPVGNVDPDDEMTIVASGSEVQLALGARQRLGRPIRVVSMPSTELFAMQSEAYRDGLLSTRSGRLLVVEAATRFGWDSVLRRPFDAVTVERFGASGSSSAVATAFGFTVDHVVERASALLSGS